jgi:hypothetical protein
MFELLEIANNHDFYDRIFPIVLADAAIYKAINRIQYIKYWEDRVTELNVAMKEIDSQADLQGIRDDIDLYTRIRATIAGLTDTIKNMNTLTSEIHQNTNFTTLFDAVQAKLEIDKRTTGDPNISSVSTERTTNNFKESSMSDEQKSSLHIGSIGNISDITGAIAIGGSVHQSGVTVVKGSQNTVGNTTTHEPLPPFGFATATAQQQFMSELDQLRKLIVDTKSQIELNASEHAGAEELMQELSGVVKSLQAAKAQASKLTVGQAVPPEQAKTFDECLKTAENLVNKAQQFGEKVAELSLKLAPVALPLLNGIRTLLKL